MRIELIQVLRGNNKRMQPLWDLMRQRDREMQKLYRMRSADARRALAGDE